MTRHDPFHPLSKRVDSGDSNPIKPVSPVNNLTQKIRSGKKNRFEKKKSDLKRKNRFEKKKSENKKSDLEKKNR